MEVLNPIEFGEQPKDKEFILDLKVKLNQIELATEEDRKYGIDHWAQLFKADT